MKNVLLLLAILLPFWSLALDPTLELSKLDENTSYGINQLGIIVPITKETNLAIEVGITSELLEESRINPTKIYSYSCKKINYRMIGVLDYTYDCMYKSFFTTPEGIPRALPEKFYKAKDSYTNWPFIFILLLSTLSIWFLLDKKIIYIWFGVIFTLMLVYSYVIEEYNMGVRYYFIAMPLIVATLFNYFYLKSKDKKKLNITSILLIILSLVLFCILF